MKKEGILLFAALFTFIATGTAGADSRSQQSPTSSASVSRQIVLKFSTAEACKKFEANLPSSVEKVVASLQTTALVRTKKALSDTQLQELRKDSGAKQIKRDVFISFERPDHWRGTAVLAKAKTGPKRQTASASCSQTKICPNNQKVKLWAQQAVDADLMQDELNRLNAPVDAVHVAVVDSGFDIAHLKNLMGPSLRVQKGFPQASDPANDQSGHGSIVASLIGGLNGIGLAPKANLTIYRANQDSEGSKVPFAEVKLSVQKACEDGNDVINVSLGEVIGATDFQLFDPVFDSDILNELQSRGCLVINAAGNSGTRSSSLTDPLSFPVLRVQAVNAEQQLWDFSSTGTISAPGENIFALSSTLVKADPDSLAPAVTCGNDPGAFVAATSYAAPIATAIAANLIAVLKQGSAYSRLSPASRIQLTSTILAASQFNGTINGYRAVLIAERWMQTQQLNPNPPVPSVAALTAYFSQPKDAACGTPVTSCLEQASCPLTLACVKNLRHRLDVCDPPEASTEQALLDYFNTTPNVEKTLTLITNLNNDASSHPDAQSLTHLANIWQQYLQQWTNAEGGLQYNYDLSMAESVLPLLMRSQAPNTSLASAPIDFSSAVIAYLDTYDFQQLGDQSNHAAGINNILAKFRDQYGMPALMKALSVAMDAKFKHGDLPPLADEAVSWAHLMDRLISDNGYQSAHTEISALDQTLYNDLKDAKALDFSDPSGVQTFLNRHSR